MHKLDIVSSMPEELVEFLKKYPTKLLAFEFGLSICDYFNEGKPVARQVVDANNYDLYKRICYIDFGDTWSHSPGMIYRALYVPLLPQ